MDDRKAVKAAVDAVMDAKQAEEEITFVSVEELCGEEPERDHKNTYLERYSKWIKHRTRAPWTVIAGAQRKHMLGGKRDLEGFYVELFKYLVLEPKLTEVAARALRNADGAVVQQIVNDAIGGSAELVQEASADAGE
jgi:hypothetical protein